MTRQLRPGEQTAARLLVGLALAGTVAGCGDGYPRDDLDLVRPALAGPLAIVARLNRMNADSLTTTRWEFALPQPCELRLTGEPESGPEQVMNIGLLHSDVLVKGNVGDPVHAVQVDFSGASKLTDQHLFEAERWTDAVEYATQFQALQRICARRR